jgi:putative holliday junction resolvase
MGRILGIDYGEKRIGIAISDPDQTISFERGIWSPKEFKEKLHEFIQSEEVEKVVLGYPLNMDGEQTAKTREVIAFKEKLEKELSIPVELMDERLSSKMASSLMGASKGVDGLAAQIILQHYIDRASKI